MKFYIMVFLFCLSITGFSQSIQIPYTQDDRDRLIRLEEKVSGMDQSLNAKIDLVEKNLNTRIDGLESKLDFISGLLLVLITVMFGFTGYLIWDRKTTLKPVQNSQRQLVELLREYAKEKGDDTLKNLLNKAAL